LAGGKQVVVDAKVSLAAYLDAVETRDPDVAAQRLTAPRPPSARARQRLGGKAVLASFEPTPEFVVLFVPGDAFLAPALERDPELLEDAMADRVLIATPTTLMAMLRTIAYTWQQEALTEHARAVFELGRDLYRRLGALGSHVDKLGRTLGRAVEDYNATVGSLERSVLVQARRMAALHVTDSDLPVVAAVDVAPRPLGAPELIVRTAVAEDGLAGSPGSHGGRARGRRRRSDRAPFARRCERRTCLSAQRRSTKRGRVPRVRPGTAGGDAYRYRVTATVEAHDRTPPPTTAHPAAAPMPLPGP
jgi:DNA recombination protein RmuC